ncbi:SET domain-containing protein [Stipitochalara longipes BDJ]|nr:SET domain-containing protein [Stipitochalara longipes BDJ]
MLTPPTSPNLAPRRSRNTTTPSPPPTLTTSSYSSSSSSSLSSSTSSSEAPPLFVTDYFEVRKSPKGGYGAFATKDIEKDIVIMSEAPLFRAMFMEVFLKFEALPKDLRDEYKTLVGWKELSNHEILAIFKTNRFETSEGRGGIFLKSSRFNHACHPYATCTYLYDVSQDRLIVTSLFPIAKDQEITISYSKCTEHLYPNYGFYCDCPGCPSADKVKKDTAYFKGPN